MNTVRPLWFQSQRLVLCLTFRDLNIGYRFRTRIYLFSILTCFSSCLTGWKNKGLTTPILTERERDSPTHYSKSSPRRSRALCGLEVWKLCILWHTDRNPHQPPTPTLARLQLLTWLSFSLFHCQDIITYFHTLKIKTILFITNDFTLRFGS